MAYNKPQGYQNKPLDFNSIGRQLSKMFGGKGDGADAPMINQVLAAFTTAMRANQSGDAQSSTGPTINKKQGYDANTMRANATAQEQGPDIQSIMKKMQPSSSYKTLYFNPGQGLGYQPLFLNLRSMNGPPK